MRNNRGYAIIVVLLMLGLISILGAGLLTMTRVDINFTGAAKNYDVLSNLADGACSIAYNDIVNNAPTSQYTGGQSSLTKIWSVPQSEKYAGSSNVLGSYNVLEGIQGYNTNTPAGFELGQGAGVGYYTEQWLGQGQALRNVGSFIVEVAISKTVTK